MPKYASEGLLFAAATAYIAASDDNNLIMLPQSTGALCLDGSSYGFYLLDDPSPDADLSRWTISMDGGGWCNDENDCWGRAQTAKGNSSKFDKQAGCFDVAGWDPGVISKGRCVHLPYCDGASFSGNRSEPWPRSKWVHPAAGTPADATCEWAAWRPKPLQ